MSLENSLITRIHKLEEENERLRQQVEALNERMTPVVPPPFGLTRQECAIWTVLERRRAAPVDALISGAGLEEVKRPEAHLRIVLKRVRAKIEPHGWVIHNRWGWGYELTQKTPTLIAEGSAA